MKIQETPKTFREKIPFQNPLFYAYRDTDGAHRVYAHYHSAFELLLMTGRKGNAIVSGTAFDFQRGDILAIGPGKVHSLYVRPDGDSSAIILQIHPGNCAALLKGFKRCSKTVFLEWMANLPLKLSLNSVEKEKLLLLAQGLSAFRTHKGHALSSAFADIAIIGQILQMIFETVQPQPYFPFIDNKLRSIINVVNRASDRPYNLDEMAKAACLSKYYLCRFFRKHTGMTLSDYSAVLRVQRAKQLMAGQRTNVTQAAMECGFESISYFIKKFKSVVGKTPKQWILVQSKNSG